MASVYSYPEEDFGYELYASMLLVFAQNEEGTASLERDLIWINLTVDAYSRKIRSTYSYRM